MSDFDSTESGLVHASDGPIISPFDFPLHVEGDAEDGPYEEQAAETSIDDEEWAEKRLNKKWSSVMQRLIRKEICWDEDEDSEDGRKYDEWTVGMNVLEDKKKKSLAEIDRYDKTSPTILHKLALDFKSENFTDLAQTTRIKIVKFLLEERKGATSQHSQDEDPILTRAIENHNIEFIKFILNFCRDHLPDLLDARDVRGANCLHYMFKPHLPEAVEQYMKTATAQKSGKRFKQKDLHLEKAIPILAEFIKDAKPSSVTAKDNFGNTPIHYAMEYKICRMPINQYPGHVLDLVKKGDLIKNRDALFNSQKESPYLYFIRTRDEFLANLGKQRPERARTSVPAAPTSTSGKSKSDNSKVVPAKHEALEPRMVASEHTGWSVHIHVPPTGNSAHRKDNPKELVSSKRRSIMATSMAMPSNDSPDNPKRHNIVSSKDIELRLMDASPGHGISRTRTTDFSSAVAYPKTQTLPHNTPLQSGAQPPIAVSPIGKVSSSSQAGDPPASTKQRVSVTHSQAEKHLTLKAVPAEDHKQFRDSAENMRRKLKVHYIRTRPDMEAKELLYGKIASDKNLYFDATHLKGKNPSDVADLIFMLDKPGGFEDTLSYVSLPVLSYSSDSIPGSNSNAKSYDSNERRRRDTSGNEDKLMGRNSAVAVFDRLADAGVRSILSLTVEEDPKSPPHTDGSIERAVRGEDSLSPDNKRQGPSIAVEAWDWRKFDLSIDVIRYASPRVCKVNLYWSGNQTVLRGWASDEGIPRLYQESYLESHGQAPHCLKTIFVHWSPGFEGLRRCEALLSDFKSRIESQTKKAVTVHLKLLTSSKADGSGADSYLGPFAPGNPRAPPDHDWIATMENFRRALMKLHDGLPQDEKPQRIKVALIDDGIDRTDLETYTRRVEVTGMSYWSSSSGRAAPNQSWHQSTHGHGTIMANSIARVNPWVELYAMRIQDEVDVGPRNDISIRIHAGSAARAIEDAIIRKVDIISISWTIRNFVTQDARGVQGPEPEPVQQLKKAIDKAKKNGILLFCSASDDIQKRGLDTLPYSQAREYAFRIGAADAYGWSDKATEDQKTIDYFFPGKQVADDFNPRTVRTTELKYRDGSSVATALAAGLASLILYLTNMMQVYSRGDHQKENKFVRYSTLLRKRDGLKKAFENIVNMDDDYKDKKFLPVWDLFGAKASELEDQTKDVAAKWEILDELCTKLAT